MLGRGSRALGFRRKKLATHHGAARRGLCHGLPSGVRRAHVPPTPGRSGTKLREIFAIKRAREFRACTHLEQRGGVVVFIDRLRQRGLTPAPTNSVCISRLGHRALGGAPFAGSPRFPWGMTSATNGYRHTSGAASVTYAKSTAAAGKRTNNFHLSHPSHCCEGRNADAPMRPPPACARTDCRPCPATLCLPDEFDPATTPLTFLNPPARGRGAHGARDA